MMTDRSMVDEETIADLLVLESFADKGYNLTLAFREGGDFGDLWINLLEGAQRVFTE